MSEIKRWELLEGSWVERSVAGGYVTYADHAALVAKLRAENEALVRQRDNLQTCVDIMNSQSPVQENRRLKALLGKYRDESGSSIDYERMLTEAHAEARSALAERDAAVSALGRIAAKGCTESRGDPEYPCSVRLESDHPDLWCSACIARAALKEPD